MDYRREIDGLRALAVSAVVLYHFWPDTFDYGYLGVDVFFVISGFLITLYIYEELSNGSFSLKNFYQRRIVRILPVTLFVLSATSFFALIILIGADYDRFIESLIASLSFTSNIYFWRDGGYFGQADSLKPLLHFWSLSVEEQFYLFFPVLFLIVFKFTKSFSVHLFVLVVLSLISLLLFLYMLRIGGANPAFFLMPFRAWEFGLGSIAALAYFKFKFKHSFFSVVFSFALIFLGLTFLAKFMVPGLIVVLGTTFFLAMKYRPNFLLDAFFQSRLVRFLGLISFSTYLWHWQLVVFLSYISIDEPDILWLAFTFVLTYVLSIFSYNFIEQPFRHSIRRNVVVIFSIAASILLLILTISMFFINPFNNNNSFSAKVASSIQTNYRCNVFEYLSYGASRACFINSQAEENYTVALIGNSHAQMYAPAIYPYLRDRNKKGLLVPLNGCLPITQFNISSDCLRLAKINLSAILSDKNITSVIIGLTWYSDQLVDSSATISPDPDKLKLSSAIHNLINILEDGGKKVFLIGPLMIPGYDLPSVLSRKIKFKDIKQESVVGYLRDERIKFDSKFNRLLAEFRARLGERFIAPSDYFCDPSYCYFGDAEGVFFSDSNHLSSYGVQKVKDLFFVIESDRK